MTKLATVIIATLSLSACAQADLAFHAFDMVTTADHVTAFRGDYYPAVYRTTCKGLPNCTD